MEALGRWLTYAPLWQIGLFLFGGMLVAGLIGAWLRKRAIARKPVAADGEQGDESSQEGYVVSAVMGLLALLVGFTFSMAIDRFDTRRTQVLEEANAIGTTYLRTQLLDEPHRARISKLLVDYTDNRIVLGKAEPGAEQRRLLAKSDAMITDLWTATVAAFPTIKSYDFSSSYIESMNNLIDMDASRKTARFAHVPPTVFTMLFFYQFMTAGVLGYVLIRKRGRHAGVLLLLLFALSLLLVIDIDRPASGSIRESQWPMEQLQASMHATPPSTFDRWNTPAPH